jgi:hypothetical protein
LRYINEPGKSLLICKSLDIFVDKLNGAFRTLDLIPDFAVQLILDVLLKANAAYRRGMETMHRDQCWRPDLSGKVFGTYDAASWRRSRDFRGVRSVGRLGCPL